MNVNVLCCFVELIIVIVVIILLFFTGTETGGRQFENEIYLMKVEVEFG